MWDRYIGEVGDLVVGRISEVGPRQWTVDVSKRERIRFFFFFNPQETRATYFLVLEQEIVTYVQLLQTNSYHECFHQFSPDLKYP